MKKLKKLLSLVLAVVMAATLTPVYTTYAATQPTAPEDGTVSGCPFVKGTGGSNSYRIPAMVTLSDGTLVAAADARWNTTYDGGGGDTVVARSSDNGSNWSYTFANYLGDNGNAYDGDSSTCFIDPELAVDSNDKIYMLVDLYPYGVAINGSGNTTPATTSGFNDNGYLKLAASGSSTYNYYLKEGKIYSSSGTAVSGYTVDAKFNVFQDGDYVSNLFFEDSPYKVVRTGYLYLTTSTDKGETWSDPTLIPNIKTSSEQVCLSSPGRGNVLSDDTIVYPVYSYNNGTQGCGIIYSTDGGASWTRSDSGIKGSSGGTTPSSWSSEAAMVEVSDTLLRVFYRNGNKTICYVDITKSGNTYTWGSAKSTGVVCNSNTQLSAIKVTSAGTDYILVSCPGNESNQSGAEYRTKGQIVTFKAGDMSEVQTTSVPSVHTTNSFMYSCMSQLSNGSVAILYEDQQNEWGTGSNCYYQMSFKTFGLNSLGIATDAADVTYTYDVTCKDKTLTVGDTAAVKATGSASDDSNVDLSGVTWTSSDANVVSVDGTGANATITAKAAGTATITATLGDEEIGSVNITVTNETYTQEEDVALTVGETSTAYTVDGTEISKKPDTGIATVKLETASAEGYTAVTSITSGKKYLMAVNTSHVLTTASSSNDWSINGYQTTSATVSDSAISGTSYDDYLWTITKLDDGNYTIQNADGAYLAINASGKSGNNYPVMTQTDPYEFTIDASTGSVGAAAISGVYLNNFGGTNACVAAWTGASEITFYEQNSGDSTLTITGQSAGSTSVIVGATKYNITVSAKESAKEQTVVLNNSMTLDPAVPEGGSVSYELTSGSDLVTLEGATVKAGSTAGTAIVVATVKAANGNPYATYTYTINVSEVTEVSAELSVAQLSEAEISAGTLLEGQYVEWTSTDASIASVGAEYDGADATANAMVLGNAEGTAVITGTVKNQDGSTVAVYTWNTTVTAASDSNTSTRHIYVKVKQIENCTVYYAINGGELIKLDQPGDDGYVQIDADITGHFNIMFFAAPDEGNALTYMGVSGSDNQYYVLSNGNPDGTGSDAWPMSSDTATQSDVSTSGSASCYKSGHGFRWCIAEGNMTLNRMKAMFSQAIALGCDGVTNFTKNGTSSYYCEVQFVASPLPTLKKVVKSITHDGTTKAYTDGDMISLGDTITYTINVTEPAYLTGDVYTSGSYTTTSAITTSNQPSYTTGALGTITYSEVDLEDQLTNNNGITAPDLGTSTADDQTFSYDTSVTLTSSNFDQVVDGVLTNTATLGYDYKSSYVTVSKRVETDANAKASIVVKVPEYVVDFGLPVKISLYDVLGESTITSGSAAYGTVSADGRYFTYTPTSVLMEKDYVTLKLSNGGTYGCYFCPATTVYYEEGFASGSWIKNSAKGSSNQTASELGANADGDHYGYDSAYSSASGASNETSEASTTSGDKATFTFTGTGVDLYGTCAKDSGSFTAIIKGATQTTAKMIMIDTASVSGTVDYTNYPEGDLYNVPFASITGLPHDTYTVTLLKMGANKVTLDGFKVYNTLEDSSVYADDLEDDPNFIEVRDLNFGTIDLSDLSGEESKYKSNTTDQIYKAVTSTENVEAVIASSSGNISASKELVDNGPKNEIYLYEGMTLTLNVNTNREAQIGLRGLQSGFDCKIGEDEQTVSTVDMFYTVKAKGGTATVIITNPDDNDADTNNILAVTKLKVCDAPDNAITTVSRESIADTLYSLGYVDKEEDTETAESGKDNGKLSNVAETGKEKNETAAAAESSKDSVALAKAVETIKLVNYKGKVLASTSLTAKGTKGKKASFSASRIRAAVKSVLPSGYAIAKASSIKTAKVVYGKKNTIKVLVGKTAKIKVTYRTKSGSKVGTATLQHIKTTASGSYTFKTSDIKAAAPARYRSLISLKAASSTRYRVISLKKGVSVKYGAVCKLTVICKKAK